MWLDDFSPKLSKFIQEFNSSSEYKEKAKEAYNKLCDVKENLIDNLQKLLDRGEKLDVLIVKSGELETQSKVIKKMQRNSIQTWKEGDDAIYSGESWYY